MTGIAFVWLDAGLLERAGRLRARVWGGAVDANAAYLDWKYLRNPYLAEPLLLLAVRGGEVVGMRGFFGTCWSRGGGASRHVLPAAAETIVAPELRDTGLFVELNERCLTEVVDRGHRCQLNLSATPENALTSVITLGWRSVAPYDVLAADVGRRGAAVRRAVSLRLRRGSRRAAFAALDRSILPGGARVAGASDADDVATLGASRPPDGPLRHVLDRAFLCWRLANPLGSYRLLLLGEPAEAYLVLGRPAWSDRMEVLDWDGATAEGRLHLLEVALLHGRPGPMRLRVAPLDREMRDGVERLGFAPLPARTRAERVARSLLVRCAPGSGDEEWRLDGLRLEDPASWDARAIAGDEI